MANSYVEYTTAGSGTNGLSQTTFTAPTKFLSINDIRIKGYNGSTWTELTISARGTTTVTLSAAPTAYSKIRVFRSSTTEALIDFQNGSRLAESDLDTAYQQGLFVAQEVAEVADPEGGSGIGNIVNSQLAGGITQGKLAGGVGTSANNLVKLDANAKLPAVDGSQLTGIINTGTWTPAFDDAGGGTFGYATQQGNYVKIGTLVYARFNIGVNSVSSLSGSICRLTGQPFTSNNDENMTVTRYQGFTNGACLRGNASGSNSVNMKSEGTNDNGNFPSSNITASTQLIGFIIYTATA